MAAEPSPSSSPPCPLDQQQYDVFLSFRGEDTRFNFTSHLHAALRRKDIITFIDDKQIERGDEISSTLLSAIERSKISIIIFSENYASSRWCLDELVKIMKCKNIIIPIFYHIDPTHVRNQTGPYEKAFAMHEIHNPLKVLEWRKTLKDAGSIAGWTSSNRLESELVESVVEDVLLKLNRNINPKFPSWLVGISNCIAKVQSLLCCGSIDVCIIGIWGMGGIGKTTIAEVLFNTFSSNFQGCSFVRNVREKWRNNKQDKLRNKLLTEIVGEHLCISTPSINSSVVDRLQRKRVLIVLDDVTTLEQIEYLVGEKSYFGFGSRIIVTTRNKNVLTIDDKLYEVKPLNTEEAHRLFCSKAFPKGQPKIDFIQLLNEVVAYAGGIPLVLKVLGSFLHSKSPKEWKSALQKLKKIPNEEIHQVLSISYEGLDSDEQQIFLDIACFLKGQRNCDIVNILDGCGFFTDIGLRNLQDKSLITISEYNKVEMHDLIQEMGWNIVRLESSNELEKQSRLWDPEEIYRLLKCKKETSCCVETMLLDMSQIKDVEISSKTFARMSKLRLLKFRVNWIRKCNLHVPKAGLESLPDALHYFHWECFPLKALPSSFSGEMLVELDLRYSRLEKLWDTEPDVPNLKLLRLKSSYHLIELPNLWKAKNLEEIDLDNCSGLQKVSSSIFSLPHLLAVDLSYCTSLRDIQSNMVSSSLRWLSLKGCSSLVEFSVCSENLEYLNLAGTAINHLPSSIQRVKMPRMFETSRSMTKLFLGNCLNLSKLPDNLSLLTELNELSLYNTNIETLPESIKLLSKLRTLDVSKCKRLRSLPELPILLRYLDACGCISLETVASSVAATHMKNSFDNQNRRCLLRQIQELKLSPRHENYWERFEFQDCTNLNRNALETIADEAIIRIRYATYLSSIDDDPYHQFHLTSKDLDAQNFEDTCRQLLIEEFPPFPKWNDIRQAESSILTIKVNANCCKECKASRFAFGMFESENTNFGFDGRHKVCMKSLDGRAWLLYDKLCHNDVTFTFPGSRVPRCFKYRAIETNQIIMELHADSHVLGFAFSVVLSPYRYDFPITIVCECYSTRPRSITIGCNHDEMKSFSDTLFLWYVTAGSNWILDECKSNHWFHFRFYVQCPLYSYKFTNEIKECGVWPIYASDLEFGNPIQFMESEVQFEINKLKEKRRRFRSLEW